MQVHLLSEGQIYWRYTLLEGRKELSIEMLPFLTVGDVWLQTQDA